MKSWAINKQVIVWFCNLFYFVFFSSSSNEWLYVKIIQIFIKILDHNYSFIQNQNNSKFLQLIQHIISLIPKIMISAFQSELNTMLLISRMYFLAFFAHFLMFRKSFCHVQTAWILRIWYFMRQLVISLTDEKYSWMWCMLKHFKLKSVFVVT